MSKPSFLFSGTRAQLLLESLVQQRKCLKVSMDLAAMKYSMKFDDIKNQMSRLADTLEHQRGELDSIKNCQDMLFKK